MIIKLFKKKKTIQVSIRQYLTKLFNRLVYFIGAFCYLNYLKSLLDSH